MTDANQTEEKIQLLSLLTGKTFTETEKTELKQTLFLLDEKYSYSPHNV